MTNTTRKVTEYVVSSHNGKTGDDGMWSTVFTTTRRAVAIRHAKRISKENKGVNVMLEAFDWEGYRTGEVETFLVPNEDTTMTRADLVAHVKDHAMEHYNDGGWDVIVECWEDSEIADRLTTMNARTKAQAIAAFADLVSVWADRQADAENSAF